MVWRSPLHGLHRQDRHSIRRTTLSGRVLRWQHDARTTRVKMDVHTVLTRIGRAAAVAVVLVMMASITVVVIAVVVVVVRVVMMLTIMVMAGLIIRVRVHKRSREGTNWSCKSHAQGRSKRKQPDHRPDKSDCPRACPFQSDQHGPLITHYSSTRADGPPAPTP